MSRRPTCPAGSAPNIARMRGRVLAALAAIMAMTASGASAATYCVPVLTTPCTDSRATLADAITAANAAPNSDTIVLAPGHFASGPAVNYETHILGAGEAATFVDGGATYGVKLNHAASSISDLNIHAPPGGSTIGLYLAGS